MPNFLNLSREFRDMIYESIAFLPQQDVFEELRNGNWKNREPLTDFEFKYSETDGSKVLYSSTHVEPIEFNNITLQSMSRASRQIYTEIHQTLAFLRRNGRKNSCNLDIALINNEILLLAWVSVPTFEKHVNKLYVAVHPVTRDNTGWNPWSSPNHFSLIGSFYGILERSLSSDPVRPTGQQMDWRQESRIHRREIFRLFNESEELIKVKILEIDIVTPKPEFTIGLSDKVKHRNALAMSEFVLGSFQSFFDTLLAMDEVQRGRGWAKDSYEGTASKLMYEHIGTIRVLHDGQFKQEWDLGKLLRDLELSSLFRNKSWQKRFETVYLNRARFFEYWHLEV